MVSRALELIELYDMEKLESEGGYFSFLTGFGNGAGCILYLITDETFSSLHMLDNDEIWFFLEGDEALQYTFIDGKENIAVLSEDRRHSIVKAGMLQGTRLREGGRYALFSTAMSPKFDEEGFSLPDSDVIESLEKGKYFYDGIHNSGVL